MRQRIAPAISLGGPSHDRQPRLQVVFRFLVLTAMTAATPEALAQRPAPPRDRDNAEFKVVTKLTVHRDRGDYKTTFTITGSTKDGRRVVSKTVATVLSKSKPEATVWLARWNEDIGAVAEFHSDSDTVTVGGRLWVGDRCRKFWDSAKAQ